MSQGDRVCMQSHDGYPHKSYERKDNLVMKIKVNPSCRKLHITFDKQLFELDGSQDGKKCIGDELQIFGKSVYVRCFH